MMSRVKWSERELFWVSVIDCVVVGTALASPGGRPTTRPVTDTGMLSARAAPLWFRGARGRPGESRLPRRLGAAAICRAVGATTRVLCRVLVLLGTTPYGADR